MLRYTADQLVLLQVPEEVEGDAELREYRYSGKTGTVIISNGQTRKIFCREDSNTHMVLAPDSQVCPTRLLLECGPVPYGAPDVLKLLPLVKQEQAGEKKYYVPMDLIRRTLPLSEREHRKALKEAKSIRLVEGTKEYMGRIDDMLLLDVLLLLRSLILLDRTRGLQEIEQDFAEIFPVQLFSVADHYAVSGKVDEKEVAKDIAGLIKRTSSSKEAEQRTLEIHGIYTD